MLALIKTKHHNITITLHMMIASHDILKSYPKLKLKQTPHRERDDPGIRFI